jgi:hypothetical protein
VDTRRTTQLRVASWNLNGATGKRAAGLGALLARSGVTPRVVMLQEAADSGVETFCEAAGLDWCVSA